MEFLAPQIHWSPLYCTQLLSIQEFYRLHCQLEMGLGGSIYMMEMGKCPKPELSPAPKPLQLICQRCKKPCQPTKGPRSGGGSVLEELACTRPSVDPRGVLRQSPSTGLLSLRGGGVASVLIIEIAKKELSGSLRINACRAEGFWNGKWGTRMTVLLNSNCATGQRASPLQLPDPLPGVWWQQGTASKGQGITRH